MSKQSFIEERLYQESETVDQYERSLVRFKASLLDEAKDLTRKSFPVLNQFSLKYDGNVMMFYHHGALDGMIKGKVLELKGKRIGVVSWLIVNPERQNGGLAGVMLEELLKHFDKQQCDMIMACTHASNMASIKGVLYYGFQSVALSWQLKTFGLKTFKLWKESFHLFDFSHILWVKAKEPLPKANFLPHAVFQYAVISLSLAFHFPLGVLQTILGAALLVFPALCSRFYISRWLLRKESNLKFCPWDSSNLVFILINCVHPLWLPLHGSLYPQDSKFVSRRVKKAITFASIVSIGVMMLSVLGLGVSSQELAKLLLYSLMIELFLPFFPFQSYAGSHILNKSKPLYLLLCLLSIILFLFMI